MSDSGDERVQLPNGGRDITTTDELEKRLRFPGEMWTTGEDWSTESPEAMARFIEMKRYEAQIGEGGKIGDTPREVVWRTRVEGWSAFVRDFPDSKLCVHAYHMLGNLYSIWANGNEEDEEKAKNYNSRCFETFPNLLSNETILARMHYARGSFREHRERVRHQVEVYRWLKTEAAELAERQTPKINGDGYYAPPVSQVYEGRVSGKIRGAAEAKAYLRRLIASHWDFLEKHGFPSAAEHGEPNIGWLILEQASDLLPADVQARIAEVMGGREARSASQPISPEDAAAEASFQSKRTVLDMTLADRLADLDVFAPDPGQARTDPDVIPAKADARRWIQRVLKKDWWPKSDRPADYLAVRSPEGYDSVYRYWQTGGTGFLAQSTAGWMRLSLRPHAGSDKPSSLGRSEVERRVGTIARRYFEDPHQVLRAARFEVVARPYGYEGRLRVEGDSARRLDQADRGHAFEWLRGLRVQTDGASFVFRLGPKTDAEGKVCDDRKAWFGLRPPRAKLPATTQAGR